KEGKVLSTQLALHLIIHHTSYKTGKLMDKDTFHNSMQSDFRDAVVAACLVDEEYRQWLVEYVCYYSYAEDVIYHALLGYQLYDDVYFLDDYGHRVILNDIKSIRRHAKRVRGITVADKTGDTSFFSILSHTTPKTYEDWSPESLEYAVEQALLYIAKQENL